MSKKESYEAQTEELLKPIAEQNHVEIYDVEFVKEGSEQYLRCYIDKEEGVSINDCEAVSRAFSDELDRVDFIPEAYILEVSSPGLGRQLKKDKHLAGSLLQEVDVKTYRPVEGQKEFTGILKAFDENTVTLGVTEDNHTKEIILNRKEIAVIKLTLDF